MRLQRITRLLQGYVDRRQLACASAWVGMGSEVVYREKFGWADLETVIPLEFETIFRIMSMTKPITAVAAMLLYEEGLFELNTPIHHFLPEFKTIKVLMPGATAINLDLESTRFPITFRHLFTNTSGLAYGGPTEDAQDQLYNPVIGPIMSGSQTVTLQESASLLAKLPLAFQPGQGWRYGLNLDVLAALVEILADMPFADFLQERIFRPLEMVDTAFALSEEKKSRLAVLYQVGEKSGELLRQNLPLPMPILMWGGGGLVSTLPDYAHFASMLANRGQWEEFQLLSPTTVAMFSQNWAAPVTLPVFQALSPEIHDGYGYSLGTAVLLDPSPTGKFGHVGEFYWGGAFSTFFFVDPFQSLYAVFLTQLTPNWTYQIPWQLKQLVYQAMV